MNRHLIQAGLLLAALAVATTACGDADDFGLSSSTTAGGATTSQATTQPTETTAASTTTAGTGTNVGERYSESTRRAYLEGCTEDAPLAACECTIAEFERRYTESEFITLALENADTAEPPAEVLEVVVSCIGELDDGSGTFPAEFRDGYLEGCVAEATIEFCTCTLDRFERVYTLEEFTTIFTQMESDGTVPPEVQEIITDCISSSG